jgi:hypothetical protein
MTRADRNNNPAAITTDVAKQGGLVEGTEYVAGDPFPQGPLVTAKLLGDPVALTIRVIDQITYYTQHGNPRWTYMAIPKKLWDTFSPEQKKVAVGCHYTNEGGVTMQHLFA